MGEKKIKSYRLGAEAMEAIAAITARDGVSAAAAVERAVIAYAADGDGVVGEQPAADAATVALAAQLEVKDSQISALTAALVSAQDSVKAAQALNAAAVGLPAAGGESAPNRGFWSRLFGR